MKNMMEDLPNDIIRLIFGYRIVNILEALFYYRHRKSKFFNILKKILENNDYKVEDFEKYPKIRYEWRHCLDDWVYMYRHKDEIEVKLNLDKIKSEVMMGLWG